MASISTSDQLGEACGPQGCLRDKADAIQDRDRQEAAGREAYGFLPVLIPRKKMKLKKTKIQTSGGHLTTAHLWLHLNSV